MPRMILLIGRMHPSNLRINPDPVPFSSMARVMHIVPPHTPAIVVIIPALAKPLRRLETDPAPKFHPSVRSCFTALLLRFALAPWRGCCIATGASLAIPWLPDGPFHVYQRGRSIAHGRRPAACLVVSKNDEHYRKGNPSFKHTWAGAVLAPRLVTFCPTTVSLVWHFLRFFLAANVGLGLQKCLAGISASLRILQTTSIGLDGATSGLEKGELSGSQRKVIMGIL